MPHYDKINNCLILVNNMIPKTLNFLDYFFNEESPIYADKTYDEFYRFCERELEKEHIEFEDEEIIRNKERVIDLWGYYWMNLLEEYMDLNHYIELISEYLFIDSLEELSSFLTMDNIIIPEDFDYQEGIVISIWNSEKGWYETDDYWCLNWGNKGFISQGLQAFFALHNLEYDLGKFEKRIEDICLKLKG